jgi:hypothetical protein
MFGRKKPPATMPQLQAGANAIRGLPQGLKQIPVNIPKPGTPLKEEQRAGQEKLANANAANKRQFPLSVNSLGKPASVSQLQAGANAIRGLPQGSQQSPTSIAQQNPLAGKNIKNIRSMGTAFGFPGKKPGMKAGGKVSSASSRGDGCAIRGKTRA